jgi:TetR/AcrR family acrAB operon transcriptional repressor
MTKKYNPQQTVEKILKVAEELFLTKGFDKTSMQDIVDALGMSKGAIFYHFKSKEDIFEATLNKIANRQLEEINDVWLKELEGLNGRDKLEAVFNRSLSASNNLATMLTMRIHDPRIIVGMMRMVVNEFAPIAANVIREGIADGSIQTEFPDECAEVMMLLPNAWCDPIIFECDIEGLERRLKYLQYLAKQVGLDVVSDEHIARNIEFTKKMYEVKDGNNN